MDTHPNGIAREDHAGFSVRIEDLFHEKLAIHIDSPDQDLLETGAIDSASFVQLLMELEKEFSIHLPITDFDFDTLVSVRTLAGMVSARRQDRSAEPPESALPHSSSPAVREHRFPAWATNNHQPSQPALTDQIESLLLSAFQLKADSIDTDLFRSGLLDSMRLVQLIVQIEQHFGISLPIEDLELESFRSIQSIATFLSSQRLQKTVTTDSDGGHLPFTFASSSS